MHVSSKNKTISNATNKSSSKHHVELNIKVSFSAEVSLPTPYECTKISSICIRFFFLTFDCDVMCFVLAIECFIFLYCTSVFLSQCGYVLAVVVVVSQLSEVTRCKFIKNKTIGTYTLHDEFCLSLGTMFRC